MLSDWEGEPLEPGTLIDGKFEVRRVLGTGAMGAVIEATHVLLRAPVALKFMSPRMVTLPGVVERFLNEGIAASRINNDHVVKVLDVSRLPSGQPYLVMEYLEGEDLAALLDREGKHGLDDVPRAVHFVLQILRGLQAAHQVGIIHRDLKPANCFVVTKDGEPDFIKIVDFGISKVQETSAEMNLTQEGSTMGTPLYVSLEQARDAARVDARSDLYSVAVILYELLCGHTPFIPKSLPDLFVQLATTTPRSLDEIRDLPAGLAALVQKGLSREPPDRFQSTADMGAALAAYADDRSELVLRQLLQRPSLAVSRSSGAPARSSIQAPSAQSAADRSAPSAVEASATRRSAGEAEGSLLAVSKSDAVAGRSVVAEAAAKPSRARKLLLPGVVLVLGAAVVALIATAPWSEPPATGAQGGAPEVTPRAASVPAAVEPVDVPDPSLLPPPRVVEIAPPAPGPRVVPSASASPAPRATPTPPPQTSATPIRKPSLNKIGIQD